MTINDQALMGLLKTGSTMTINSIKSTILSMRLATPISEREVGYNHAIKDVINIINIYADVTAAKQAQVDIDQEKTLNE